MNEHDTSQFLKHEPCPSCGSKNNLARYTDGHGFCFGCNHYESADGAEPKNTKEKAISDELNAYSYAEFLPLSARGITEETCRKFGVKVGEHQGKKVHFYPFYKDNTVIACKLRDKDKNFKVIGEGNKLPFFGQHLWNPGKMLVITEGELDCMSVSQVQGNKWATVSVPNGAQGASRVFRSQLEWLEQFESVIIMFDMDEPGQEAAKACAELLSPGKAKIASLSMKDPNEMLLAGLQQDIIKAIWNAKEFRPDGIISGKDLWDVVAHEEAVVSVQYPYAGLNEKTKGLRKGELVTVTAGSGIGKSAIVREIAYDLITKGEKVGMIMLEENPKRTALGLMAIHLNKPIHISKEGIDETDLRIAFDTTVGSGNLFMYDHWGSSDINNLVSRVRFMARGLGCSWVVLDHLSIVVSGLGDGDERRLIDNAMTMLRTLVEEVGIGLILVSHLKRPEGNRGHEEGATTSLSQLRGSHAIAQLSDIVIGLERNQQDVENANTTTVRVLKNRFSGDTGIACELYFNKESGRLTEQPFAQEAYAF